MTEPLSEDRGAAHGNAAVHLPHRTTQGHLEVRRASDDALVWRSHGLAAGIDSIRIDAWHGRFLECGEGWAVLPPGRYGLRWSSDGQDRVDLEDLEVTAQVLLDETATNGSIGLSPAWQATGKWSSQARGLVAQDHPSFLFREASMHGLLEASFLLPAVPDRTLGFGLIARHYNANNGLRVSCRFGPAGWTASLACLRGKAGDAHVPTLAEKHFSRLPSCCQIGWSFNGSRHTVQVNGEECLSARESHMGGVDVIGLWADAGVTLAGARLLTTQRTPQIVIARPTYEARIQPGNLRSLTVRDGPGSLFWESGLQFGHIGGSEIKFTQAAAMHRTEEGAVATVVAWRGPMPKCVEQADDVRGEAGGRAFFYPDRIVIQDDVLTWVRRSVGPDLDLLGRAMAGPARLAFAGEERFGEWRLPPDGRSAAVAAPPSRSWPVSVLFPMAHAGRLWWLKALIDLRFPARETAPGLFFAWQCPRGLTASHDFRVSPTVPGQAYGFSIVVRWQAADDTATVERDALHQRDDWMTPMRLEALSGQLVRHVGDGEHPREAVDFDGCFDRAAGRYVLQAERGLAQVRCDPVGIPRYGVGWTVRGLHAHDRIRCLLNDRPLRENEQILTQRASNGEWWLWLATPLLEAATLAVAAP